MSHVTVVGNIGKDPELKFSGAGNAYVNFSVAESKKKPNSDEYTSVWFDFVAFKKLAENIAESLTKGTRVIVTGRLDQETWEDKETGGKRSKVKIIVDSIGPDLLWATAVVTKQERGQ